MINCTQGSLLRYCDVFIVYGPRLDFRALCRQLRVNEDNKNKNVVVVEMAVKDHIFMQISPGLWAIVRGKFA